MILSLESGEGMRISGHHHHGHRRGHAAAAAAGAAVGGLAFDLLIAVTPRGDDASAAYAEAAGIATLVQPTAAGLTDLWNKVVQHCLAHKYSHCFLANNDVLVGAGAVGAMATALDSRQLDLAIPFTRHGAGTLQLDAYSAQYGKKAADIEPSAQAADALLDSSLSWQRLQIALLAQRPQTHVRVKKYMAYFFGMRADWIRANLLGDGSQRLWNDTRWKNYAQEENTPPARMGGVRGAYVYHFRGSTLDSASCKNGWLDCATWQTNHRPDMESGWWKAEPEGL